MACKPGSVRMAFAKLDDYSSRTSVTSCLMRPTRTSLAGSPVLIKQLCPYVVLLRMGFTLPALSPDLRCALTAPFHPYMHEPAKGNACGLFSVALSLGSPPLDAIQHPDPVKPGLSSTVMPAAVIQPSVPYGHLCQKGVAKSNIRSFEKRNGSDGYRISPSIVSRKISSSSHLSSASAKAILSASI